MQPSVGRGLVPRRVVLALLGLLAACDGAGPATGRSGAALERAGDAPTQSDAPAASLSADDVIYAASSVVRVIEHGKADATIALRRTVSEIAFDPTGKHAFLAASDGVHLVDARTHRDLRRLTEVPARSVVVSVAQGKLYVLDHAVLTLPDGHAEPQSFHVRRLDLSTLAEDLDVDVGQRMLAIGVPAAPTSPLLILSEAGALATLRLPTGAAAPLPGREALGGRVRLNPVLGGDGRTLYVPVEGPQARIAEIDTETGAVHPIRLGRDAYLRGLAVSPDGETLYVNALDRVGAVDLASSAQTVRWAEAELPAPHQGLAVSPDGARLYLARPVHDGAGSVTVVDAATLEMLGSIHTPGISPYTLGVRPATR